MSSRESEGGVARLIVRWRIHEPRAFDRQHREPDALVLDLVAGLGRAAEHPEDEAAERVVVLDRQRDAELLVEVVDREGAVDTHAAVV